ncbi:hypothetical protein DFR33_102357 [Bradymonas sediminis]|nr:hypothetical protein DFR33_102357 [Bradymonas sediminis]
MLNPQPARAADNTHAKPNVKRFLLFSPHYFSPSARAQLKPLKVKRNLRAPADTPGDALSNPAGSRRYNRADNARSTGILRTGMCMDDAPAKHVYMQQLYLCSQKPKGK